MPLRILFIVLAFLLFANIVIMILSVLTNQNLYKTKKKLIINVISILAIIMALIYIILPMINI